MRASRPTSTALVAGAVAAVLGWPPGGAPASVSSPAVVEVGTWNLHRFGHPDAPRSSAEVRAMADNVASSGVHVLALQQIVVTRLGDAGEPRSYAMDELVATLAHDHGQSWEYWMNGGKGDLRLGWMWREDLLALEPAPLVGIPVKKVACQLVGKQGKKKKVKVTPFPSAPVLAHVGTGEGLTDFSLVNVELRGPRPAWGEGSLSEARRAASASLAGWIQEAWDGTSGPLADILRAPPAAKQTAVASAAGGPPVQVKPLAPAFHPLLPSAHHVSMKSYKKVLAHLDHDLCVLGTLNSPVDPEGDLAPLLSMGMHLAGGGAPTHVGGDVLDGVLLSVAMGQEHLLGADRVGPGQAFSIHPAPVTKGASPHHLVSFPVAVRADDD